MKIFEAPKETSDFLYWLSCRKEKFRDMSYYHVDISKIDRDFRIAEFTNFLSLNIRDSESCIIQTKIDNQAILVTSARHNKTLSNLDNQIRDNLIQHNFLTGIGNFHPDNLVQFTDRANVLLNKNDISGHIALKRATRLVNHVMALDDDILILKQIEKALSGVGNLSCLSNPAGFIEQYVQFAPDILFLDIHLQRVKGSDIVERLKNTIDPNAYIIMISSDTMKSTIMDVKDSGAKGFVMKPFNPQQLVQHVMRSPSYVSKVAGLM